MVCHKLTYDGSNAGTSHLNHLFPHIKYFNEPTKGTFWNISRIVTILVRAGPRHIDATTKFIIWDPKQFNNLAPCKPIFLKVFHYTRLAGLLTTACQIFQNYGSRKKLVQIKPPHYVPDFLNRYIRGIVLWLQLKNKYKIWVHACSKLHVFQIFKPRQIAILITTFFLM